MSVAELETDIHWSDLSRRVRNNMGLGRDKFARLLDVSPRTVMRWENGMNDENVAPRQIQKLKLLALSLDNRALEEQQETMTALLGQAENLRADYEQRATTIRRYQTPVSVEAPKWFEDLLKLKREENWSALCIMTPHFLPREPEGAARRAETITPEIEAMAYLWLGNAFFMTGKPHEAIEAFNKALQLERAPKLLRAVLFSNKGYALSRLGRKDDALAALDESLRLDPTHRGALRNRLAVFSHAGDESGMLEAAQALLAHFPEANDPQSDFGKELLSDPDLRNFIQSEHFARIFPRLAD